MTRTIRRAVCRHLALGALALAPLAFASRAAAQSPTPENTVITNTATATWTDANTNTYASASASASVTVGFAAGVDVASAASVSPASPSTANSLVFTITNAGNGTDRFSVSSTAGAGVTITSYVYGGTSYATLAALNTALAAANVAAGANLAVEVVYSVAAGQGGQTIPISLTATSVRTTTASDTSTTNVIPPVAAGVAVAPDGGTFDRLPSNGTSYSQVYTVSNSGNAGDSFSLTASLSAAGSVTIVSTNGTAGASGGTVTIAAGATQSVTVVYTVNDVAAGSTADLRLTATSTTSGTVTDNGYVTVRVIRATITMTKAAFRDDRTTAVGGGTVLPGEFIQYRITLTNSGAASATTVNVSDPLPAQVTYDAAQGDAAGWTLSESGGTVTAALAGTLDPAASRFFWIRVRIK